MEVEEVDLKKDFGNRYLMNKILKLVKAPVKQL